VRLVEHLQEQLDQLLAQVAGADAIRERLDNLVSVYPFNEYEYIISHLLAADVLSLDAYHELRDEYLARNMFLYIFEISAPRTFGDSWAQGHLKELVPDLQKPSKKRDPDYSGQYDFSLGEIKIEVKASRAVDADVNAPLYVKALASDSKKPFWMNFQQIKPGLLRRFCLGGCVARHNQVLGSVLSRSREQPALLERTAPRQCRRRAVALATR